MHNSPKWLARVLEEIQELAELGRISLTRKARRELLSLGLGLDEVDVDLEAADFFRRKVSGGSGEWMYEWKPLVFDEELYIKIILRGTCVVLSFHEDEAQDEESADEDDG